MSDLMTWAKREVEIAKQDGDTDGYVGACYDSALRALETLAKDRHSGMSIGVTMQILNSLVQYKPLTPIDETNIRWHNNCNELDGKICYQADRMTSLFKDVYADGRVEYHDVNRARAYYSSSPTVGWSSGLISNICNDMYPITFPYTGDPTYKFMCEDYLTDPANGDYDTVYVISVQASDSDEVVPINRYFREPHEDEPKEGTYHGYVEIDKDEFEDRVVLHNERVAKLKHGDTDDFTMRHSVDTDDDESLEGII